MKLTKESRDTIIGIASGILLLGLIIAGGAHKIAEAPHVGDHVVCMTNLDNVYGVKKDDGIVTEEGHEYLIIDSKISRWRRRTDCSVVSK